MLLNGWKMRETTAGAYHAGTHPEDLEDCYVLRPGRVSLSEVWDVCGTLDGSGNVILLGDWAENDGELIVEPSTKLYYSPPERFA